MLLGDEWRHDVLSYSCRFFFAGGPVVSILTLPFSVAEPMVFHVHCFQFFDDVVVDLMMPSAVVLFVCIGVRGWG